MRRLTAAALAMGVAGSLALGSQTVFAAAPKITSFTPTSGPIGTQVVITGTALSSPSAVKFDGTTATFTGGTATSLTATAPATGTGPISITTAGGTATSAGSFAVTPSAALTPASGHPSVIVTVSGAGFTPYSSVDVYFDTTDAALAVSNALGVVSIQVPVPTASQPGAHWITLDERANHFAAQQPFTVGTNWVMDGFSSGNSGLNPFENTLNTDNVAGLTTAWGAAIGTVSNTAPMVEINGDLFVGDIAGGIHAFNGAGKLLWHASETDTFQEVSPGAASGLVFFGGGSSVYAFKTACRTDGGVCAPKWVTNIGTTIGTGTSNLIDAGITVFQGELYVGGADGLIHPLAPTTGVAGTPFSAAAAFGTAGITTPVVFEADGSYYYGAANVLLVQRNNGASGSVSYASGTIISPIALSAGHGFYATSDGYLRAINGSWSAAISGGNNCFGGFSAPAVANSVVYAGGCSSLGAYQVSNGALLWSVTTSGNVSGLSVANGVLYACVATQVVAYAASYGELLWTGGDCNTPPIVANGRIYAGYSADVAAYSLAALNSAPSAAKTTKPELTELKPNLRLAPQKTTD
jgi:IPT/TIG domain/PQQ-like domain